MGHNSMGCLLVPVTMTYLVSVASQVLKAILTPFCKENLLRPTVRSTWKRAVFQKQGKSYRRWTDPTTYLYARVPALRSQAGEEGHGWDQSPSQAGGRHHPSIFREQKWPCENMIGCECLLLRHCCLLSLAQCLRAITVFKAVLG